MRARSLFFLFKEIQQQRDFRSLTDAQTAAVQSTEAPGSGPITVTAAEPPYVPGIWSSSWGCRTGTPPACSCCNSRAQIGSSGKNCKAEGVLGRGKVCGRVRLHSRRPSPPPSPGRLEPRPGRRSLRCRAGPLFPRVPQQVPIPGARNASPGAKEGPPGTCQSGLLDLV